jgi:hypothetical protein
MDDEQYSLEKLVWSEADYDEMGFHDVNIRAVYFSTDTPEVLFDVDYIFKWVMPTPPDEYFTFWVSPATLVFRDVSDVELSWQGGDQFVLWELERSEEEILPAGHVRWLWTLAGNVGGSASLRATGYSLYVRQEPRYINRQNLWSEERGGVSFHRGFEEQQDGERRNGQAG